MRIYFDHNATTPPDPDGHRGGRARARRRFRQRRRASTTSDSARRRCSTRLARPWPSSSALSRPRSCSRAAAPRPTTSRCAARPRRSRPTAGATSSPPSIEHEAVLNTIKALGRRGWTSTLLPVDASGIVSPGVAGRPRSPPTPRSSPSCTRTTRSARSSRSPTSPRSRTSTARSSIPTPCSRSGRFPVDVRALGVDLLALSAHKFNGPKGAGALWIRRGTRLAATMTGGKHERNRRGGTENVPGIAGMGVAAQLARKKLVDRRARARGAARPARARHARTVPGTAVNGDPAPRVPNTTNISFDGIEAESLLIALDLEGFAVSTGSACSSGTLEPSHVLRAMGLPVAPHAELDPLQPRRRQRRGAGRRATREAARGRRRSFARWCVGRRFTDSAKAEATNRSESTRL